MQETIPVLVASKLDSDTYVITHQLKEPDLHHWNSPGSSSIFEVEVGEFSDRHWKALGKIQLGHPFIVPNSTNPIPLFRLSNEDKLTFSGLRHIELQGASNFRDIGGYWASNESQLQYGKIFRSDNLSRLTPPDWATLEKLRIKTVIDLRRDDEKTTSPTKLPPNSDIEIVEIPIEGKILGRTEVLQHILSKKIMRISHDDMEEMYLDILNIARNELHEAVRILLDPLRGNKIVHCTAGKDRTGLTIALVQLLSGVSKKEIISDFLLSNSFRTPARMAALSEKFRSHSINMEDIAPYLSASKQALVKALDVLENRYGGAEQYLYGGKPPIISDNGDLKKYLLY